jgi:hypothetical protein
MIKPKGRKAEDEDGLISLSDSNQSDDDDFTLI